MKILKLTLLLLITLSFSYCSNDDDSDTEQEQEQEITEQESTQLDPNIVLDGLLIAGASKINGSAPQPIGNVDLSINSTSSALLNEGFEIEFSSGNSIAGAYLIITDENGNDASSYYDIPESAFSFTTESNTKKHFNSKNTKQGGNELLIEIGFNNSVPVGIFCYTICVYDENGNISNPQTICITVQAWGGNNDLVAGWNLTRYQDTYQESNIDVGLNEEYCYQSILYCDNGNTLNYEYCYTWQEFTINLNEDGTYNLFFKKIDSYINYEDSQNTCSIIEEENQFYEYNSQGNWAYNSNDSENKLVLAEYESISNENGEIYEENPGAGNAYIIFDDAITISGNTFVMTFDYEEDGIETYTFQK